MHKVSIILQKNFTQTSQFALVTHTMPLWHERAGKMEKIQFLQIQYFIIPYFFILI